MKGEGADSDNTRDRCSGRRRVTVRCFVSIFWRVAPDVFALLACRGAVRRTAMR